MSVELSKTRSIQLRFPIGARVECNCGGGGDQWQPGTVIDHWYTQRSFPNGMCVPYQCELDDGRTIYVPADTEQCVRSTTKKGAKSRSEDARYELSKPPTGGPYPTLRFGFGQRVVCETENGWTHGTVEDLF